IHGKTTTTRTFNCYLKLGNRAIVAKEQWTEAYEDLARTSSQDMIKEARSKSDKLDEELVAEDALLGQQAKVQKVILGDLN
ncbi:hypothetical protein Ancab_028838, partial [Ancistrocladus abbreviatus]